MSPSYDNSRRGGVNFSHFLHDLNEIQPQEPSPRNESSSPDEDLAMFTNTQFFDWDQGNSQVQREFPIPGKDAETPISAPSEAPTSASAAIGEFDFNISSDDFNNFDFSTFATSAVPNFSDNLGNLQSLPPNQQVAYPPGAAAQNQYGVAAHAGTKRPSGQLNFEEQSRLAAEEDKRRRNTAASARFRIKKKAREQALERREKELSEEVVQLKNRITHLETENKWLRGLVMEKTGSKESKFDPKLAAALKVLGKESDSEEEHPTKSDKKVGKTEAN